MKNCANLEFESVQPCQNRACPLDGYFEEWSTWSNCDRQCDGGLKKRKRFCHEPKNGGKSCSGTYVQVVSCNEHPCVPSEGCQGTPFAKWFPESLSFSQFSRSIIFHILTRASNEIISGSQKLEKKIIEKCRTLKKTLFLDFFLRSGYQLWF